MAEYPGSNPNQPAATIVVHTPVLGHEPVTTTCPHCQSIITTHVEYTASGRTHLNALLLCLLCGCIPGCIPYCCDSCQTATHTCPVCHQTLGIHDS